MSILRTSTLHRARTDLDEAHPLRRASDAARDAAGLDRTKLVEPRIESGARLGDRYELLKEIGHGGFGRVFRAFDEIEERYIALKILHRLDGTPSAPSDASNSSTNLQWGFREEFRLLTQLHHPNLAAVYDFGFDEDRGLIYFTQELVGGQPLHHILHRLKREQILELVIQLSLSLEFLHTRGLVHGDLKPSNILVERRGTSNELRAKLIDFGLARIFGVGQWRRSSVLRTASRHSEQQLMGSPGFSAPEWVEGRRIDGRADIYSLAATLYSALLGRHPFPGQNFEQALKAQYRWKADFAGDLIPALGQTGAELVGRMLEPEPDRRPQSAQSIALELLRRQSGELSAQAPDDQRREFARLLVESLPFVDRGHYRELIFTRALELIRYPGRDASSSGRRRMLHEPRQTRIRTIFVQAPSGMGKRRLMSELRREAQLAGLTFLRADFSVPARGCLGAFADVIRQLRGLLGEDSPVVFRYRRLLRACDDPNYVDRSAIEQFTEFIHAAATARPCVIHFANLGQSPEDFGRVEQLCHAIALLGTPLLLCVTTEPHRRLPELIGRLTRIQLAEHWTLRPFSRHELTQISAGIVGEGGVADTLADMLDQQTGGHPLSVREAIRIYIESSILVREGSRWCVRPNTAAIRGLPESMVERCAQRLDALGRSAWVIVRLLYVLNEPMAEESIAALAQIPRGQCHRTLDLLDGEGLILRSVGSDGTHVSLAHDAIRKAVAKRCAHELDDTRIELAQNIRAHGYADPHLAYLRARLLDEVRDTVDAETALQSASQQLIDIGQHHLAAELLTRLIRRQREGGVNRLHALLKSHLVLAEQGIGALTDPRKERSHYEAGVLIAQLLGDHRAQALFWLILADLSLVESRGQRSDILEALDHAAKEALRGQDRLLELRIAIRQGSVLMSAGAHEDATAQSRRAMAILDLAEANDADACDAVGLRLRCLALRGHLEKAHALHDATRDRAARTGVVHRQNYLAGIAYLGILAQEPQRAIPEMRDAIAQLESMNATRILHRPLHHLGDLQLHAGDFQGAERSFRAAIRIASLYGNEETTQLERGFLGYTLARLGDVNEGAALLAEALKSLDPSGDSFFHQQIRLLSAEVAHLDGQSARARRELEEMIAEFQSNRETSLARLAQSSLARIERELPTTLQRRRDRHEDLPAEVVSTIRTSPLRHPN